MNLFFNQLSSLLKKKTASMKMDRVGAKKKVVVISQFLPRFDRTSADLRLYHIIKILSKDFEVLYLYNTKTENDRKYIKSLKSCGHVKLKKSPQNIADVLNFVSNCNADYLWITSLWRIQYVKFMTEFVKKIKKKVNAPEIIIDTIDFHYKEFYRRYKVSGKREDLDIADKFLRYEKTLYCIADKVVVVSKDEKTDILNAVQAIKSIAIVPNIHDILSEQNPLNDRQHICFVGNFGNKHNVDAAAYFVEKIFDHVLNENPDTEFHIIGFKSNLIASQFDKPNVRIIGPVDDIERILNRYRLFVCPMTYGTGMKGKISMAAAVGLPIVTTHIGSEGFPVKDGRECFIADDPIEFAKKCNLCLADNVIWKQFSKKLKEMIQENFSSAAVARKMRKIFPVDGI